MKLYKVKSRGRTPIVHITIDVTKKNEKQTKFLIGKYENALPKPKEDNIVEVKIKKKRKRKPKKGQKK